MTQPNHKSQENLSDHDRLNGWKEIAVHLGKSVRTMQRWERELGFPVHRIHTARGEIIYTFRSEIGAWEAQAEQAGRNRSNQA